ncbi:MAG: DUF1036 domain-containing protein [Alphaproteobacteria bacterium]
MIVKFVARVFLIAAAVLVVLLATPGRALAEYRLCNETSYVFDATIGVQSRGEVTTRGWFQVLPGQCRVVVKGPLEADKYYFFSRVPDYYDIAATRFDGGRRLCVGTGDFLIAGAQECTDPSNRLEQFIEVQPRTSGKDWELSFAEEAKFERPQAGLAGVQRLLGMLGYNAGQVDGVSGDLTKNSMREFLAAANLKPANEAAPEVYLALVSELRAKQAGVGLQICNETRFLIWTALGIPEKGKAVARGWYKVGAGECVRPHKKSLDGTFIYSFGEAIDDNGPIISADNIPLIWDGDTLLCTKSTRFNITDHTNCEAKGLNATRFRRIELGGAKSWTIRYTEPR